MIFIILPITLILLTPVVIHLSARLVYDKSFSFANLVVFSSILIAGFISISVEVLNLFNSVTASSIRSLWLILAILQLLSIFGLLLRYKPRIEFSIPQKVYKSVDWRLMARAGSIAMIIVATFIMAVLTPTFEGDSISYHLPRVMHWIQNRSVEFYGTPDIRQLWMPPWGGYAILHAMLLSGTDHWANIVQWSSMVLSVIAIGWIADLLGMKKSDSYYAMGYFLTIPMTIFMSVNPLTDLIVTYWILCSFLLVVLWSDNPQSRFLPVLLAITVGIGIQTKGTYMPYAFMIGIFALYRFIKQKAYQELVLGGSLIVAGVMLFNLPHWVRTANAFGNPLGHPVHIELLRNEEISLVAALSGTVRTFGLFLVTPFASLNAFLRRIIILAHLALGVHPYDPAFTFDDDFHLIWTWPGVSSAPLHLILGVISFVVIWYPKKATSFQRARWLSVIALGGLLAFNGIFEWQTTTRFGLPFLSLAAPIAGNIIAGIDRRAFRRALVLMLFLLSLPSLNGIPNRSYLPYPDAFSEANIFGGSRELKAFENNPSWLEFFKDPAEEVLQSGCQAIALKIDSSDVEYPWWVVLQPHEEDRMIKHILIWPGLESYQSPDFVPCAVICTVCSEADAPIMGLAPRRWNVMVTVFLRR